MNLWNLTYRLWRYRETNLWPFLLFCLNRFFPSCSCHLRKTRKIINWLIFENNFCIKYQNKTKVKKETSLRTKNRADLKSVRIFLAVVFHLLIGRKPVSFFPQSLSIKTWNSQAIETEQSLLILLLFSIKFSSTDYDGIIYIFILQTFF